MYTTQFKQEIGTFNIEKIVGFPSSEMEKNEDTAGKKVGNDYAISEVHNESEETSEEDTTESDDDSDSDSEDIKESIDYSEDYAISEVSKKSEEISEVDDDSASEDNEEVEDKKFKEVNQNSLIL